MAALVKHAKRYGVDGVTDVAVAAGFDVHSLTSLIVALDEIEKAQAGRYQQKNRRLSAATRAKRLLGIEEDTDKKQEAT